MKSSWVVRIVAGVVLLLLSFSLAGCGSSAQGKVVDEIMRHLAAHDSAAAFEHMSSVAKDSGVTADGLNAFITDYATLIDGYRDLSVTNMSISTSEGVSTTEMTGTFDYEDGSSGTFEALLHKEGDMWMITVLNIEK